MNTYENEMATMLRQGMSIDEVMNKMRTQLANAEAQIKAEQEAERKLAEQNAAKKAAEERAQVLVDIANRAMENKLTAADVSYIQNIYAAQKYPEHARMFAEMLSADEVDSTIEMAVAAMSTVSPLLNIFGIKGGWNEVLDGLTKKDLQNAQKEARTETMQKAKEMQSVMESLFGETTATGAKKTPTKPSDDQVLRNFVNSL